MLAWGDGSSAFVSKVRSWLLVLRKMGGWIRLEVSVPAVGGGGEFRSKIKSARGVAPADGLLGDGLISFAGTSVFCSLDECLLQLPSKRSRDGVLFDLDLGGGGRKQHSPTMRMMQSRPPRGPGT